MSVSRLSSIGTLLLLAACDQILNLQPRDDEPRDAPGGDALDASDLVCHGTGLLEVCLAPPTIGTLTLAGNVDTTVGNGCIAVPQPGGLELCVRHAETIEINDGIRVTGSRPLVLVATRTITITSMLDVSSTNLGRVGAGAADDCVSGDDGANGTSNAAGGAGGSFAFQGGGGGTTSSVSGGAPGPELLLVTAIGGCPGGRGGTAGAGTNARGGAGGGAVYLIASSRIVVTATGSINASGAGGQGGAAVNHGAGGGGAGGLIGLDAPMVEIVGTATARGGGGGGGGGTGAGENGGDVTGPFGPVRGGAAPSGGSFGGDGCGRGIGGQPGPTTNRGAGGGGGGCGFIRIYGERVISGTTNPLPTPALP
ncbi:MAG: hypothetical protein H0T89_12140 [Deltaproteobacteria bacterium]|nr:hypothetical protein [Deltaproteobacteria bacterium]